MPTGQPDPSSPQERSDRFSPQERSDVGGSAGPAGEGGNRGSAGQAGEAGMSLADAVETTADRMIRESIESGDFDDLPGTGKPIPGAGTVDDEMWWVRSWLKRNRDSSSQGFNNSA